MKRLKFERGNRENLIHEDLVDVRHNDEHVALLRYQTVRELFNVRLKPGAIAEFDFTVKRVLP